MYEKTDVYPYTKEYGTKKTATPKAKEMFSGYRWFQIESLTWNSLLVLFLGFFMGRIVLLGELMPFGPAFISASLCVGSGLVAVLGVAVGLFSVLQGVQLAGRLIVITALVAMYVTVPKNLREHPVVLPGIVAAVTLVVRTVGLSFTDPVPYNYVSAIFEAGMAGILAFVYLRALPLLTVLWVNRGKKLSTEEILYLLLLFGGLIAGASGIGYMQITLQGLLSRLVVLIVAFAGGTGMGATAGALVGILPGLAFTAMPALVGAYSFAGLLAGFCRGFGKTGAALGFVIGNIILCVYMSGYDRLTGVLFETGLAVLLFLLVPGRFMMRYADRNEPDSIKPETEKNAPLRNNRFKEILACRVQGMAEVFGELSKSFEQSALAGTPLCEDKSLQDLLNEIVDRVCRDCPLQRVCWEKDFYRTHQCLLDILAKVDTGADSATEVLPEFLRSRCTRTKELVLTAFCLYELYSAKKSWAGRFGKSRNIISEQLKSVSSIMDKLSQELQVSSELSGRHDLDLLTGLKEKGMEIYDIYTAGHPNGHLEISISMPSCRGQISCRYKVAPALTELLGQPYSVVGMNCFSREEVSTNQCCDGGECVSGCSFKLYPSLMYRLEVGVARAGKGGSDICGDSYSVVYLNRGKVALILSDGMGSGETAELESSTTIRLLEKLLQSGLEREPAIRTVNSFMLMRSPEDSFATIDLVIVDLCNGSSEFVKIGAPAGYLLRGKRVAPIASSALPIGIIDDIEITTVTKTLLNQDMLVLVTDGVTDACRASASEEEEEWLLKVLPDTKNLPPQEVAEFIMKLAQTCCEKEESQDDMTVMVVRIEKEEI